MRLDGALAGPLILAVCAVLRASALQSRIVYDLEAEGEGASDDLQGQSEGRSYSLEGGDQGASDDLQGQSQGRSYSLEGGDQGASDDLAAEGEGESTDLQDQSEGRSYSLEGGDQGASDDLAAEGVGDVPADTRSEREWQRSAAQPEETAPQAEPDVYDGPPRKPGCYMRMLSRCPRSPLRSEAWRHDSWAEEHGLDEAGCKRRKRTWDRHCGSQDAELLYVGGETATAWSFGAPPAAPAAQPGAPPAAPREAGGGRGAPAGLQEAEEPASLARAPAAAGGSSAPAAAAPQGAEGYFNLAQAHGDAASEEAADLEEAHGDAMSEESADLEQAHGDAVSEVATDLEQAHGDSMLEVATNLEQDHSDTDEATNVEQAHTDAESDEFVRYPTTPGCFMRMPSGCPKQPMRTLSWRHDAWAEDNDLDEEHCKKRKTTWDRYCGATDAKIAFVPKQ